MRAWRRSPVRSAPWPLAGCGSDEPESAAPRAAEQERRSRARPRRSRRCTTRPTSCSDGGAEPSTRASTELRGYPVVVNKWASWCAPCRAEFPFFQSQAVKRGKKVAFLGVNAQRQRRRRRASSCDEFPVSYPELQGPRPEDRRRCFKGVAGVPHHRLLRPQGRARLRAPGRLRHRGEAGRGHRALRSLTSAGRQAQHAPTRRSTPRWTLRQRVFCGEQGVSRRRPTATAATARRSTSWRSRAGALVGTCRLLVERAARPAGPAGGGARARGRGHRRRHAAPRPSAAARRGRRRAHATCTPRPTRGRSTSAAGYESAGDVFVEEGIEHVTMEKTPCLSCASTRSSGLRVIVAGERGERPGALARGRAAAADRSRDGPVPSRATRTAPRRRSTRCGRTAARRRPGWRVRVVPNLYPALAPATAPRPPDPLAEGRGEPELFAVRPAAGAHEVIVNAPRAGVLAARAGRPAAGGGDGGVAGADARPRRAPRYVHVIVNEGREAGASLPHTHAQLYALPFVPAAVARERERFTAYSERTHGPQPAGGPAPGGGAAARAGRRRRLRGGGASARSRRRVPFHLQIVPRRPGGALRGRGAARRRRCCTKRSRGWPPCSAACRR